MKHFDKSNIDGNKRRVPPEALCEGGLVNNVRDISTYAKATVGRPAFRLRLTWLRRTGRPLILPCPLLLNKLKPRFSGLFLLILYILSNIILLEKFIAVGIDELNARIRQSNADKPYPLQHFLQFGPFTIFEAHLTST
jgi:hypothetical protein